MRSPLGFDDRGVVAALQNGVTDRAVGNVKVKFFTTEGTEDTEESVRELNPWCDFVFRVVGELGGRKLGCLTPLFLRTYS
jgi:hypothetical protein